jgi:dolichyl-diphosphooligosaccharide--protein glycosyltransferase
MRWITIAALLAVVVAGGVGARSLLWRGVFRGDAVVFPLGDAYYHMRRAEFTLAHPGQVLLFDPLVNHPDGSWVPWPPLHTLLLAGTAELLGGTKAALERAGAWYPVAIGAATALPVYGAASVLAGPGTALAAAALAVGFPAGIAYSDLGNADHHCTVTFFVALWLWGALAVMRQASGRHAGAHALIVVARLGVLLTWPGSILYLALADGTSVAIGVARGRRQVLSGLAFGLFGTALLVSVLVPRLGPPVGGTYSTLALSQLHATAMIALAVVAAAGAALEARWPRRSTVSRLAAAGAVALVAGLALLALPGLIDTLREGAGFVGKEDPWAAFNAEQRPLFVLRSGRTRGLLQPIWYFGGFAYAIPLLPIVLWLRARRSAEHDATLVLAAWAAGVGALAMFQIRYGSDYSPVAGVGFAVALDELGRRVGGGWRGRTAVAAAALLGAGPFVAQTVEQARSSWLAGQHPTPPGDPLLVTPTGTIYRFAEEIRRVTPETGGYFDATERPDYAILCPPNVGHLLHYVAHRATPADNFGPYSGSRHFRQAQRFFELRSEQHAVEVSEALGAPYVLTMEFGAVGYQGLTQRLHREDGVEREDLPHWERFRLVTEGPRGGRPLSDMFSAAALPGVEPYKLFERVAGAVLEVHAAPGAGVEAVAVIRTPLGRQFRFPVHRKADAEGVARIRVPYATDGAAPTGAIGPWRVTADGAAHLVDVSEAAVREGQVVTVASGGEETP